MRGPYTARVSSPVHRAPRPSGRASPLAVLGLALVGSTSALVGCARDERPPNVVILMLDTARPDYLSVYGHERRTTPFLERFAAEGARFDRAYSSSCWSLPSHASIFTGQPPRVHRADEVHTVVSSAVPLLAEELGALGYRTAAFSANAWVGKKSGLDKGFETFRNLSARIYTPHVQALANDPEGRHAAPEQHHVVVPVAEWLQSVPTDPRPFFLFVNLVEPHMPYLPDMRSLDSILDVEERWKAIQDFYPNAKSGVVSFRHYRREDPLSDEEWSLLKSMYEGVLRLTDELTETIVRALDAVAPREHTLVFVLSDHGENLGDHGHFQHSFNLYDSNLRIALLARGPGFAPGRIEARLVQIADLHATILAAAGAGATIRPGTVDLRAEIPAGRVLTAELSHPLESLKMYPEDVRKAGGMKAYERELLAAVGPRYKLIRGSDGVDELYDLEQDPGELRPLARAEVAPAALAELEAALARLLEREPAPLGDETEREHDAEALEALRALGYVGEDAQAEPRPERKPASKAGAEGLRNRRKDKQE